MGALMKSISHCISILLIGAGAILGCATLHGSRDNVNLTMTPVREIKYAKDYNGYNYILTRFVFTGDSIDKWTEGMEQINVWKKDYPSTPEATFKLLSEKRKKRCPDSSSNIINQDAGSILFETRTANCAPNPDEHSITRVLYSKESIWILIYTHKVKELPAELRTQWVGNLSTATVVTVTGR